VPVFDIVLIFSCRWIIANNTTPFGIPIWNQMVLQAPLNGNLARLGRFGKRTQERVGVSKLCYMLYLISIGCRCNSETIRKIRKVGEAKAAAVANAAAEVKDAADAKADAETNAAVGAKRRRRNPSQ
jgi:hypothetical protein